MIAVFISSAMRKHDQHGSKAITARSRLSGATTGIVGIPRQDAAI